MKLFTLTLIAVFFTIGPLASQPAYFKKLKAFRSGYILQHEVVKGKDKNYFRFFAVDSSCKVNGMFEKIFDTTGFTMKTSAGTTKHYYKYGRVKFLLHDTAMQLFIYQSKALIYTSYKDYLFIPFTDITSGDESYAGGRYIDLLIGDIKNQQLQIDFNKAYNPYCAYATGFYCPIPPKENALTAAIKAGEKVFAKPMH